MQSDICKKKVCYERNIRWIQTVVIKEQYCIKDRLKKLNIDENIL